MKKLITRLTAVGVCTAMLFTIAVNAGAASVQAEESAKSDNPDITVLNESVTVADNQIYASAYNVPESSVYGFEFRGENSGSYKVAYASLAKSPSRINLPSTQKYVFWLRGEESGGSNGTYYSYKNTGGTYRKIRIKLSDFDYDFNSDGSQIEESTTYGTHRFHFGGLETTSNGKFYSGLCVKSGSAYTAVTPDKNGEVEFYVSKEIGVDTRYCTGFDFEYHNPDGSVTYGSGGGTTGCDLYGLTIGDADSNGFVNVGDAAKIQLALSKITNLNKIQNYAADANSDGKVNIFDCTYIQMYLAKK